MKQQPNEAKKQQKKVRMARKAGEKWLIRLSNAELSLALGNQINGIEAYECNLTSISSVLPDRSTCR